MLSSIVKSSTNRSLPAICSRNFSTSHVFMADPGRQSAADKAKGAMTPNSEKGPLQKGKEALDDAASTLQPEESKSTTQKATDALSGNSNENSESLLDKAKNVLGMNKENK